MTAYCTYQCAVLTFPAPDVHGQWIAHCLDFDVVTQGNSIVHAATMIREAVSAVIIDDIEREVDPRLRGARAWGGLIGKWGAYYLAICGGRHVDARDNVIEFPDNDAEHEVLAYTFVCKFEADDDAPTEAN